MPSLKTIGAFLLTALLGLLALFSSRAKQAKAERDQARQQADIAQQANQLHREVDRTVRKLEEKHREETINEKKKLDQGIRDQLDSDW